ncbi:hypothetical protein LINPERPRIM_LOCUS17080 [Linum perenne]
MEALLFCNPAEALMIIKSPNRHEYNAPPTKGFKEVKTSINWRERGKCKTCRSGDRVGRRLIKYRGTKLKHKWKKKKKRKEERTDQRNIEPHKTKKSSKCYQKNNRRYNVGIEYKKKRSSNHLISPKRSKCDEGCRLEGNRGGRVLHTNLFSQNISRISKALILLLSSTKMELLLNHARRLSISNQKPNLNLIPRTQSANERGSCMLVGKMITKRQISTSTMKGATRLPWGQEGEVDIRNEGDNIFVITFQTDHQREKVWKKRPWVIANTLLNLKRWDGDRDPKEVAFQTADLWIHIHNLPARYRSEENVKEISQYFVKFLECDRAGFEPGRWKRFIRLFAEVRIDDPLQITGELTSGGKDLVEFKYEKIQDYCLYCGRIGHSESSCDDREEDIRKGESGEIPGCFDFSIRAGTESRKLNFAEGEDTQHRRLASSPSMGLGNTEEMITPERHVSRGNIGASNLNVTGGSGPNQISLVQAQGQEYTPTTEDIFGGKELEGGEKSRAEKADFKPN